MEDDAPKPKDVVLLGPPTADGDGVHVLRARDDGTTDVSLYEEVKADRRSAEDTRNMHRGILRNLRRPPALADIPRP